MHAEEVPFSRAQSGLRETGWEGAGGVRDGDSGGGSVYVCECKYERACARVCWCEFWHVCACASVCKQACVSVPAVPVVVPVCRNLISLRAEQFRPRTANHRF